MPEGLRDWERGGLLEAIAYYRSKLEASNRVCGASRHVQKVQKVSRRCPEGVQKMSRRCPEGWKRMWERLESPLQVC